MLYIGDTFYDEHDLVNVEKFGEFKLILKNSEPSNRKMNLCSIAEFICLSNLKHHRINGCYLGDGTFEIRIYPDCEGIWTYCTRSNSASLNNVVGLFRCTVPSAS